MKKILYITLSALMLTACANGNSNPELGVIPDSSITRSADRAGFSAFTANVAIDDDYLPLTIKYTKTLDAVASVQFASGLPVRERTAHE